MNKDIVQEVKLKNSLGDFKFRVGEEKHQNRSHIFQELSKKKGILGVGSLVKKIPSLTSQTAKLSECA